MAAPGLHKGRAVVKEGKLLKNRYLMAPKPIGRGSYGTVYVADDIASEGSARVAVKRLGKAETPSCNVTQHRSKVQQEVSRASTYLL